MVNADVTIWRLSPLLSLRIFSTCSTALGHNMQIADAGAAALTNLHGGVTEHELSSPCRRLMGIRFQVAALSGSHP